LAQHLDADENLITARLMGKWDPQTTSFDELVEGDKSDDLSRPYPFFLAYALDLDPAELGNPADWIVERKWDGIRGQLIIRGGQLFIWTRGEELVTDKYPELHPLSSVLPDGTVIDCELLAYRDGKPMPFQEMQKRIGRKTVSKKTLLETPVRAIVYDLMEWDGADIRTKPQHERRRLLESLCADAMVDDMLILSELVHEDSWDEYDRQRLSARTYDCEGLMLKHRDAIYDVGRKRGTWWKW
jgi:DNA ligase-1